MPFVLMKIFEEAPRRFDRWMNFLTLGTLQEIREEIAGKLIRPNAAVLEIGCGTGALMEMLAHQGAKVIGIDTAEPMIGVAQSRLAEAELLHVAKVKKLHALQVEDEFEPATFDQIVSVLAFSEMSDDEVDCLLSQCYGVLKPDGELIVADEVEPNSFFARYTYRMYRTLARLVTFLGLQAKDLKKGNVFLKLLYFTIELPLMLLAFCVAPALTHPLAEFDRRLQRAGFRVRRTRTYLRGSLQLIHASVEEIQGNGQSTAFVDQRAHLQLEREEVYHESKGVWAFLRDLPKVVVLQHVFRSIPYPTPSRLIRIGNPGANSPVLVTTNYDLTVRRVCRALKDVDCFLLVAPAAGIDVWCAAGGGRFTIDSIISILKTSRIAELVDHRRLILPQLCANGLNLFDVRRRTGWSAVFGPVDAADVLEFLKTRRRTERMMRVSYGVKDRLEMAVAMWGSLSLRYTVFPVLIFGLGVAYLFILMLAALSLIVSLGCYKIPGRTFVQKAGMIAVPASVMFVVGQMYLTAGLDRSSFQWVVLLFMGAYLVGSSYPSYTPLWQCGYSKLFYGFPNLRLDIIADRCIGCKLCDQVCPVECFSTTPNHKVIFSQPNLCEGCMACLVQCPTEAIINQVAEEHQRSSQCQ